MTDKRLKPNGHYVMPLEEIKAILNEYNISGTYYLGTLSVYFTDQHLENTSRVIKNDEIQELLKIAHNYTFDYVVEMHLVIEDYLDEDYIKYNTLIWQGNQHMIDLYWFNYV